MTQENAIAVRDKILQLKEESLKLPQVEIPVFNYFSDGVYAREMRVPAGTTITGKIHKYSTVDVLLEGEIVVVDDSGIPKLLSAPMIFESKPGLSKAGHVLKDVRWVTIHGTRGDDSQDVDALVSNLVVETYDKYLEHERSLLLKEK